MKRVGIDLGTTNTVAAIGDHVLSIGHEGADSLPSVIAFMPNGTTMAGALARRRRSIDGANTIFSSKRIIGRPFQHSITRAFCERYPFSIVDRGDNTPAFETRAGLFTPTDIASLLLGRVFERVEPALDELEVVITVPSGFNDIQRAATLSAAEQAGFYGVRLVDEPSAVAWAYHMDPDVSGLVAVYDLGGGTFDVSVLDCGGSSPKLLAGASEPFLGGDDIDNQIACWVHEEVLKSHNWDLMNYSEVYVRLLAECERAKIRLSSEEETIIELAEVDPECPIAGEGLLIQRKVMNRLAGQLVQRTFLACDDVLRNAGVQSGDLRAVLMAGGSAHLSIVRESVETYFGRTPCIELDPVQVVARGASLAASSIV
jgi:molecular chaperone DnaK